MEGYNTLLASARQWDGEAGMIYGHFLGWLEIIPPLLSRDS